MFEERTRRGFKVKTQEKVLVEKPGGGSMRKIRRRFEERNQERVRGVKSGEGSRRETR